MGYNAMHDSFYTHAILTPRGWLLQGITGVIGDLGWWVYPVCLTTSLKAYYYIYAFNIRLAVHL